MEQKTSDRLILEGQYKAFAALIREHGVPYPLLSDAELLQVSDAELQRYVRIVRDLARTPTT